VWDASIAMSSSLRIRIGLLLSNDFAQSWLALLGLASKTKTLLVKRKSGLLWVDNCSFVI
jgi:hypothetical protein